MPQLFIGQIICSEKVAQKINSKHGVTLDEVRDAVQWPARPLRASWLGSDLDPRGPRLALEGRTAQGRILRVVLYPVDVDEGAWRLGTAVPLA